MFTTFSTILAAIAAAFASLTPSADSPADLDPAVCLSGYEAECVWIGDRFTDTDETVVTYAEANDVGLYVELSDGTVVDLPACDAEDGADCYWIASGQGNGQGVSFVDVAGTAYYFGETLR